MGAGYAALNWSDLGTSVQADLRIKGLDSGWFASKGKSDDLRRTVFNIYVKMTGTIVGGRRLWDFVGRQYDVSLGKLEFIVAPNVRDFMSALASAKKQFTNPGVHTKRNWDSREWIARMQLHFKHFEGWTDTNRVEAHIDPYGFYSGPGIGKANFIEMLIHGCTMQKYKDVREIQEALIRKHWGKTILYK